MKKKYIIVPRDKRGILFLNRKGEDEKIFTQKDIAENYVKLINSAKIFGSLGVEELIEEKNN